MDGVVESMIAESPSEVASAPVLDSWEDGASSTPEDGTAKPVVDDDIDIDIIDPDLDGDDEKLKPIPKKIIQSQEPKPKKEHINIVIIGHVGKTRSSHVNLLNVKSKFI